MEEQLIEALNNINEKLDIALEQQLTQRARGRRQTPGRGGALSRDARRWA